MDRKVAVVTGASGGIGLELAKLLAADGYELIISARSEDRLHELAAEIGAAYGVQVHVIAMDLAEPHAAEALWREVTAIAAEVEVLVNNAGVGDAADFVEEDAERMERMLQLNIVTLSVLTRLVLPGMVERRCGRVLNVSSLAAFQPGGPGMAAYYASKTYVLSLSRSIQRELRGSGVSVTALCPGATLTRFEETARAQRTLLFRWHRPMEAREVARCGYRGMQRGRGVVIPGWLNRVQSWVWVLPDALGLELNRLLLKQRR